MNENITLATSITKDESSIPLAAIKSNWSYNLSFDVSGECLLDIKVKDGVTNKTIQSITKHNQFITGHYKYRFIPLKDGVLTCDFRGTGKGIVSNLTVMKGE